MDQFINKNTLKGNQRVFAVHTTGGRMILGMLMMLALYLPSIAQQRQPTLAYQQLAQKTGDGLGLDPGQRGRFVQCFTQKLDKARIALEKASPEQRRLKLQDIEKECLEGVDIAFRWGTGATENLKRFFFTHPQLSDFPADQRKELVDCLIDQLHQLYPNGLNNLPPEVAQTIMAGCKKQIKRTGK